MDEVAEKGCCARGLLTVSESDCEQVVETAGHEGESLSTLTIFEVWLRLRRIWCCAPMKRTVTRPTRKVQYPLWGMGRARDHDMRVTRPLGGLQTRNSPEFASLFHIQARQSRALTATAVF